MKDELKPCPFCGNKAEGDWDYYDEFYEITCTFCRARMSSSDYEEVINNWNTRNAQP